MAYTEQYDIIVIGGGHAGIEASLVAAKLGLNALLLTLNIDTIGQMSCNPSIGGTAKGHLVKEIDALGGVIGMLADQTAIQYRMLNRSKGPAVWSPRTQNDRQLYKKEALNMVEKAARLVIKQEEAIDLIVENQQVKGIITAIGNQYQAQCIILTAGTFLNGLMHVGFQTLAGGRLAEAPASCLSDALKNNGLKLGRLKTGTSPRIMRDSINFDKTAAQPGDTETFAFSFRNQAPVIEQFPCYVIRTNESTHKLIMKNLDRSPLYTGKIVGIGPRYCPSIETKIMRFQERNSHTVFIEPEGRDSGECYLNGLSTSLPYDVQVDMLHTISGLENAKISRPGYAVEYDFIYPVQLLPTLETKTIRNLFCAGQINGSSGYEEAAAQGLIAGLNAVLKIRDEKPFTLKRYEAYIGVLIDDLITKNTIEPYRMFTSLAEHRLILRIDNVIDRLMPYGVKYRLISAEEYEPYRNDRQIIDNVLETLKTRIVKPEIADPILDDKGETRIAAEKGGENLIQLLKRPTIKYADINQMGAPNVSIENAKRIEIEVKYEGYIQRENDMIDRLRQLESEKLSINFDYDSVHGLSNEARTKLTEVKPLDLDQASRIQGISPSDILILLMYLKKINNNG